MGRSRGIFRKDECNYGRLLASYFGDSCAPGAKDVLHDQRFSSRSSNEADSLCKLCSVQAQGASGVNRNEIDASVENVFTADKNPNTRGQMRSMDVEEGNFCF